MLATILLTSLLANLSWADPASPSQTELRWRHLSSKTGDLPVPGPSTQQTGAVVADFDKDGVKDFILSFREKPPALVWYRRTNTGWDRLHRERLLDDRGGWRGS
jgi:hypothetical protein